MLPSVSSRIFKNIQSSWVAMVSHLGAAMLYLLFLQQISDISVIKIRISVSCGSKRKLISLNSLFFSQGWAYEIVCHSETLMCSITLSPLLGVDVCVYWQLLANNESLYDIQDNMGHILACRCCNEPVSILASPQFNAACVYGLRECQIAV